MTTDLSTQTARHPQRLTVVGLGYLGATHAICMAKLGHRVVGVDVDPDKVAALRSGVLPFHEPGLQEHLDEMLATGRIAFTADLARAADFADTHFVCVGTPQKDGTNAADLGFVEAAVDALASRIERRALIVGKSTVPVGTARRLAERVAAQSRPGADIEVAWNPEFLREGFAVEDTLCPDRLVFGVDSDWALDRLIDVFDPVLGAGTPVIVSDLATAELVKVAANAFLATKISFINAVAEVCEATGADVGQLADALGRDPRIGSRFLKPGLGFGGGCLPKDIRAFAHRAEELGVGRAVAFLHEMDEINQRRRERMVDVVREFAGGDLAGTRVAALGAAFKPDSDDVRDAPALEVARMLSMEGAEVRVYDPAAAENAHRTYPDLDYAASLDEATRGADVVALLTEWPEFVDADPAELARNVRQRRVVDGRRVLDAERYVNAGWEYRALGQAESLTRTDAVPAVPRW
ncbi:UDP-glucose dehydrogenase family protein [Microbacterium immunditiarum]|uniref:UDP-glucose 6-dehydrogenase n=1 Tax=Microbacterium immunditiarum TaxID=337480 RepID=A0A7Y9KLK9_9MICO|nr:UDP-glucose/GDP-mannose dehydrogenase family protein [Microbacterium immunditiarum]NYE19869.1 UDPglucose 6-dehydrogenase [Microbacterium immunditiarum]